MYKKNITLHEPSFDGNEKKYLIDCINSGWISTSGKYIELLVRGFSDSIIIRGKLYIKTRAGFLLRSHVHKSGIVQNE